MSDRPSRRKAKAAIEEIRPDLVSLIGQLAPNIKADRYGVIVGDDTSGRVPALIVRAAINYYRAKHGLPKLPLFFVPGVGGRHPDDSAPFDYRMAQVGERIKEAAGDKPVLLVTDFIGTGRTLAHFIQHFHTMGLRVHAAAVRSSPTAFDPEVAQIVPTPLPSVLSKGDELFVGSVQDDGISLDGDHTVSGVQRKVFPSKYEGILVLYDWDDTRPATIEARHRSGVVARHLARTLEH